MIPDPNSNIFTKSMSQLWHNASQLWHCVTIVTRLEILVLFIRWNILFLDLFFCGGNFSFCLIVTIPRRQQMSLSTLTWLAANFQLIFTCRIYRKDQQPSEIYRPVSSKHCPVSGVRIMNLNWPDIFTVTQKVSG